MNPPVAPSAPPPRGRHQRTGKAGSAVAAGLRRIAASCGAHGAIEQLMRFMRRLCFLLLLCCTGTLAVAQDHEREARWAEQTLQALVVGDAVYLQQKNGHRFLALYTEAAKPRGAAII